jgi:hypothetical protein
MNWMRPSRSSRNQIANQLGQMSIFLALIFQVLFVFFAMVINIGLLVHDKINLQNSVDLGAYYAASKQAEILNEIAHLNYQIRQDYKLLAWRYWVIGTLGRDGKVDPTLLPPSRQPNPSIDIVRPYGLGPNRIEEIPVACLANPNWWEFALFSNSLATGGLARSPDENYCWGSYNTISPPIPVMLAPMTFATAVFNMAAFRLARESRTNYLGSCLEASPLSWAFVAAIMTDYKHSIAFKKEAIKKLRANLVSADPLDREGKSIRLGAITTIQKNLTESNLASFQAANVQMLNGLTLGGCDRGTRPGEKTIPEILTQPGLYFTILQEVPGGSCRVNPTFQTEFAAIPNAPGILNQYDPTGEMRSRVSGEPANLEDKYHSTLGFEKNPWCMAYMGIKTSTSPRKPFAPFGRPVNLEARSFAQPFGGRIGPWYSKSWTSRDQATSDPVDQPAAVRNTPGVPAKLNPAPGQEKRTDPLTSARLNPGSGGAYSYSAYSIPNYSRFPGDTLGLRSAHAQSLGKRIFMQTNRGAPAFANSDTDKRIRLYWFYGFSNIATSGDTLVFDDPAAASVGAMPPFMASLRQLEAASVAPDLFDISYYSVDPEANLNYTEIARTNPARYGLPGVPVGDLGSRQTISDMQKYSIKDQILAVMSGATVDLTRVYWMIRSWEHLLTGWAPNRATDFQFPVARFGRCENGSALDTAMIPGKCAAGGRVGYSVRNISRDHLIGVWNIGGEGAAPQPILNAPGGDIDF